MKIIYLSPRSGYRGDLKSDTIWGHLCWGIRQVYGENELNNIIADCINGNPPFVISSVFPMVSYPEENGQKKNIHYFPRPILPPSTHEPLPKDWTYQEKLNYLGAKKQARKIKWISQELFEAIIQGKYQNRKLLEETLPNSESYPPPESKAKIITRNKIDRLKGGGTLTLPGGGQLFHTEEHFWKSSVSLFFLIHGATDQMMGALRYLSHIGIGGDRSTGKGFFNVSEPKDFQFTDEPKDQDANAMVNLSLYHPNKAELVYYHGKFYNASLSDRQGRLGFYNYSNVRKKALMIYEEGSLFPVIQFKRQMGRLRKVKSKDPKIHLHHDVYHNGYALMVKMKL